MVGVGGGASYHADSIEPVEIQNLQCPLCSFMKTDAASLGGTLVSLYFATRLVRIRGSIYKSARGVRV